MNFLLPYFFSGSALLLFLLRSLLAVWLQLRSPLSCLSIASRKICAITTITLISCNSKLFYSSLTSETNNQQMMMVNLYFTFHFILINTFDEKADRSDIL